MSKSQLTPFGHATSGAFGAALALIITYPIDIVKTRSQAASSSNDLEDNQEFFSMRSRRSMAYTYLLPPFRQIQTSIKHILRKEGWKGLYTGLPASIVGCMGSNFSYFYYYFYIKLLFHQRYPSPPSTSTQLLLSALAGILSQLFTLPSSVIITRQQTDPPHSRLTIWQTCQSIFQHSGISGFWKGLQPSLILVLNPAITYGLYEPIKQLMLRGQQRALKSWEVFLVGAISKTLATMVTYPYIMAKTRLQLKPLESSNSKRARATSASEVLLKVYQTDGLKGWYKGMQMQIMKAVLSQALLFMLKDKLDGYTLAMFKKIDLKTMTPKVKSPHP